jgi:hypothetical protein
LIFAVPESAAKTNKTWPRGSSHRLQKFWEKRGSEEKRLASSENEILKFNDAKNRKNSVFFKTPVFGDQAAHAYTQNQGCQIFLWT